MKLLNPDGTEFGEATASLAALAPPVGHAIAVGEIAFVRLSHGLRFYAPRDRALWEVAQAAGPMPGAGALISK